METIETIMMWHRDTFPEATLDGQKKKFDEELGEFLNAKTVEEHYKELSDMFIVACGVARFSVRATSMFAIVEMNIKDDELFQAALDKKMELNRQRKWDKGNGEYKHIGEDNG